MKRGCAWASVLILFTSFSSCGQSLPRDPARNEADSRAARVLSSLCPSVAVADTTSQAYRLEERMAEYGVPGVSIAVVHNGRI